MHCPSPFLHLPQTLFLYLFYFLPHFIYFPAHLISSLPGSLPANDLIPALLPSPYLFTCRGRVNGETLRERSLAGSRAELSDAWPWLALRPQQKLQGVSPECKGEQILTLWDRVMRWMGVPRLVQTDWAISPNPCLLKSISLTSQIIFLCLYLKNVRRVTAFDYVSS